MSDQAPTLTLTTVEGPTACSHEISRDRPCTIGRLKESDLCLLHEHVSRRHAQVICRSGAWFVVDLESTWGTFLNGVRLTKLRPAVLAGGDVLRIGPWTLRVQGPAAIGEKGPSTLAAATIDDAAVASTRIERTGGIQTAWKSDRRLNLLLECMARLADELDESALAASAIQMLVAGSGYARGAVLRLLDGGGEVAIVASWPNAGAAGSGSESQGQQSSQFGLSRSLLKEAMSGQAVVLTGGVAFEASRSVSSMKIHSAICLPITLGGIVVGFIYLDARGSESTVQGDAAMFCEAAAAAYSLALANVKRAELEGRERLLAAELIAARAVQQQMTPAVAEQVGDMSYAARTLPGMFVAGDIFDAFRLEDGRLAMMVGDVSGRGIAAGMHMAMVQAFVHAELMRRVPPAMLMESLNRYLLPRLAGRFVSLWLGLIAPDGTIEFVDAGHGHWMVHRHDGSIEHAIDMAFERNYTLGVEPDEPGYAFSSSTISLAPGERVLLYTDGIIEQRSPHGERYRRLRLAESLRASGGVQEAVEACYRDVRKFAACNELEDDSTVAVLQRGRRGGLFVR